MPLGHRSRLGRSPLGQSGELRLLVRSNQPVDGVDLRPLHLPVLLLLRRHRPRKNSLLTGAHLRRRRRRALRLLLLTHAHQRTGGGGGGLLLLPPILPLRRTFARVGVVGMAGCATV
eukprot:scaffold2409_cov121-Isochrysis_galbana.AAC.2